MKKLLYKECKLAASPLSYWFLAGALLTFVPGYPILLGAFFTTLGIFYSFQSARENNDIPYTLLLPVSRKDAVTGKFAFTVLLETGSFLIMVLITAVRMLFLSDVPVYTENALMGANLTFLGFALVIFGLFNFIFLSGFFKTAYYFAKPFVAYSVSSLLVITAAETLHHIPGAEALYVLGTETVGAQAIAGAAGCVCFCVLTFTGYRRAVRRFLLADI